MEIPGNLIPTAARTFVEDLLHLGFTVEEERYDEQMFGNCMIVLGRDQMRVRLVRDRGQWFVEVATATGEDWFSPVVWLAFLQDSAPQLDVADFATQIGLLRDHLDRIAAITPSVSTLELEDLRSRRSKPR